MRRTRRTRSDPGGAVVRQAGVKWSFEFERASWCWPLRWHSSSLGQWMSEFFMEQPETNLETNESKRTSIKGFQIITDSSGRRKGGVRVAERSAHTSAMVISHWETFFFFFSFLFFFSSPFLEEKEPSFLTSGYISDPKSIKHRPIKFSFVKGKPKRSVLLNLAIGNALGKMVNKINRNRLEKRREGKIFTDTFLLFLPFFFFPSFLPSPIDFYLPRGRSIDVNENIGISLLGKFVASSSCKTVWSMDRRASDRKLCVSLSSAPEVTARRHTDHATICRFADCIFFRAALSREEKLLRVCFSHGRPSSVDDWRQFPWPRKCLFPSFDREGEKKFTKETIKECFSNDLELFVGNNVFPNVFPSLLRALSLCLFIVINVNIR